MILLHAGILIPACKHIVDYLVAGEHMAKDNGYEISPMNPGWIKRRVPDEYADNSLKEMRLITKICDQQIFIDR